MGASASSFPDNQSLIDHLNEISPMPYHIERVFRLVDRSHFTIEPNEYVYRDSAWTSGALHLSSPSIYATVLTELEICPGQSVLNIGSGTGYLSTMFGLLLGSNGVNHGIEINESNVSFAFKRLAKLIATSDAVLELDFCQPLFMAGNIFHLVPLATRPHSSPNSVTDVDDTGAFHLHGETLIEPPPFVDGNYWPTYDRIYVGSEVATERHLAAILRLLRVGGYLIAPFNDELLKIHRPEPNRLVTSRLLDVSFACLTLPSGDDDYNPFKLPPTRRVERLDRLACRCFRRQLRRIITDRRAGPPILGRFAGKPRPRSPLWATDNGEDAPPQREEEMAEHPGGGGDGDGSLDPQPSTSVETVSSQKREASDRGDHALFAEKSPIDREATPQKRHCENPSLSASSSHGPQQQSSVSATTTSGSDAGLSHPESTANSTAGVNQDSNHQAQHSHQSSASATTTSGSDAGLSHPESTANSTAGVNQSEGEDGDSDETDDRDEEKPDRSIWIPPSYTYGTEMEELMMSRELRIGEFARQLVLEIL